LEFDVKEFPKYGKGGVYGSLCFQADRAKGPFPFSIMKMGRLFFIRNIFHNVLDPTFEDFTQGI
jgi:hypothetical protein